ncbi:hypothetical protein L0337_29235 [candidate division KSB1 bacterium]|nr:hypothetical protein [candidate division KSB1 bacterium]
MPVPTHREDCECKMWSTNCPDCGKGVYYFTCSCGSKVFFELNTPPWNPHKDRCIPYLVRYLIEIENISETRVRRIVEEYSNTSGIPIPPEIHRRLITMENKGRGGLIVSEIKPNDKECITIGEIVSINVQVNFFKRLNYVDNKMGRALLGRIVKESYVEITIREYPEGDTRHCLQYTFFITLKAFEQSKLGPHSRALAVLNSYTTPDRQKIWLADDLKKAS